MAYNTSNTTVTDEGTFRIADTATYTGVYYSIIPESATVIDTLTVTLADGTTTVNAKTVRGLTAMAAGIPYFPGAGCYFSTIKLTSGIIVANK